MNENENETDVEPIEAEAEAEAEESTEPTGIPSPFEAALRSRLDGTAVIMGDGREWVLANYVPSLAPVFDRIYDDNLMRGKYRPEDIRLATSYLLRENYDLTPEAIATLVIGADNDRLVFAVEDALFGPEREHRTWSDWAIGSMFANGIDPATVPPSRLGVVLEILVETGRTVPPGKFISAAEAASTFALARRQVKPAEGPQGPLPCPE